MIVNHWAPVFTQLYGHTFPESYCAVDTEYTGGSEDKDIIFEIGHTLVEDRKITDQLGIVIDWTDHPIVPWWWVEKALRRLELKMGRPHRVTKEVMQREGLKPEKAFSFYHEFFTSLKRRGIPFAAHHGYYADERLINGNFRGFIHKTFRFGENGLFDTGAIEKATQCYESEDPELSKNRARWLPRPDDTMESYFRRVVSAPVKGVYWRLELCLQKYGLDTRYALDLNGLHTVEADTMAVHLLMEQFRSMLTHTNGPETLDPPGLARILEMELAKHAERGVRERQEAREYEEERPRVAATRGARVRRRGQRSL